MSRPSLLMSLAQSPLRRLLSSYALLLGVSLSAASAAPEGQELTKSSRTLSAKGKALIQDLGALRFERLGHPVVRWDHTPPVFASKEQPHKLLVALVRFPDLDFDRFKGEATQHKQLRDYYQALLFDPEYKRPNTLSHYFADQSYGQYHLQGEVLPPITLTHPRAYYGRPKRPEGGSWRNDSDTEGLVEEVLTKLGETYPDLDWASFDQWDPNDFDGDGERAEPDGYLDHFVMVYAGGGQSSCQGLYKLHTKLTPDVGPEVFSGLNQRELECADRIWPHRFMVQRREGMGPRLEGTLNPLGGVPVREGLWARDYNMQSEYTEPSTFIHEFGHSIGLPDVYARQTNNSTGAWELMSSTASPSPQGLSAWSRLMLGWLKPTVIFPPEAGGEQRTQAELVALDQPTHRFETSVAPALAKMRELKKTASDELDEALSPEERAKAKEALKEALKDGLKEAKEATSELKQALKERLLNPVKESALAESLSAHTKELHDKVKGQLEAVGEAGSELAGKVGEAAKKAAERVKSELKALAPTRALLVALPPQKKEVHLINLEARHGAWALYSGQGNELNRAVSFTLNLSDLTPGAEVELSMDAWWEIEGGWDFAYLEARSTREGSAWARLVDPAHMPAKHGHDGPTSKPGLTGLSGDEDGDGKNEHQEGCDPKAKIDYSDEKRAKSPCELPSWSEARVSLSEFAGQEVMVRVRYFTDTAAVERGLLIDNLKVQVKGEESPRFSEGFEGELNPAITLTGFSKSQGQHSFETPHFYMVERRDPYAGSADPTSPTFRYDSALSKARPIFGYDSERGVMTATQLRARPGALVWYVNGSYAWSENEPTQNGPGRGFLLAIDANPNELKLPVLKPFYKGSSKDKDTRYELSGAEAQRLLERAALKTICFVRSAWSYPADLPSAFFQTCEGPQLPSMRVEGKTPMFGYEMINTLLPGEARAPYLSVSELYDFKRKGDVITWSLRDRALRSLHMVDAPFSSVPFEGGLEVLSVEGDTLKSVARYAHPAVSVFDDRERWQNPHLRFGGVEVPPYGLMMRFTDQDNTSLVELSWEE